MENVQLQIYEKNADIGGTWFENRSAPDVKCTSRFVPVLIMLADIQAVRATFHHTTTSLPGSQIRTGLTCEAVQTPMYFRSQY